MSKASSGAPLQIVYVMGYNHSDSTLLELILNAHPDVIGVGELAMLVPVREGGTEWPDETFWQAILAKWSIHLVRDGRGVLWSLKKAYDRSNFRTKNIATLFSARRSLLQNVKGALIRYDQRAYLWLTTRLWVLSNYLGNQVRKQLGPQRAMLCRYEDMVAHPLTTFQTMGEFIGIDPSPMLAKVTQGEPLAPSYVFAGNGRVRQQVQLHLKLDARWVGNVPPADRLGFHLLTGWLMHQYDYPNHVHTNRER